MSSNPNLIVHHADNGHLHRCNLLRYCIVNTNKLPYNCIKLSSIFCIRSVNILLDNNYNAGPCIDTVIHLGLYTSRCTSCGARPVLPRQPIPIQPDASLKVSSASYRILSLEHDAQICATRWEFLEFKLATQIRPSSAVESDRVKSMQRTSAFIYMNLAADTCDRRRR